MGIGVCRDGRVFDGGGGRVGAFGAEEFGVGSGFVEGELMAMDWVEGGHVNGDIRHRHHNGGTT